MRSRASKPSSATSHFTLARTGCFGRTRFRRRSRRGLQDHDTTVLLGKVVTPVVGIRRPTQLHRVESEGRGVGSVRVGLDDVPSENAECDAVVGPGPIHPTEQTGHLAVACGRGHGTLSLVGPEASPCTRQ